MEPQHSKLESPTVVVAHKQGARKSMPAGCFIISQSAYLGDVR